VKLGSYMIWAAVAGAAGVFVLLGYFTNLDVFINLRLILLRWGVLLAAGGLGIGLVNLASVHLVKVSDQETGWPYSGVLIVFFTFTLALGLFFGPDSTWTLFVFKFVQLPLESSLMALLAIVLVLAGVRLLARRRDALSLVFLLTAILILLGTGPWLAGSESKTHEGITWIRAWLAQVWAAAGARGILLGVAIGAVVTGLRVLMAADRPYGS
jgi:hypothetical protein